MEPLLNVAHNHGQTSFHQSVRSVACRKVGVVPGHRQMELNSTTAEEVKVNVLHRSHERKAC